VVHGPAAGLNAARRLYAPECVEGVFSEVCVYGMLHSGALENRYTSNLEVVSREN
jgi:hypothetical protein